MLFKYLGRAIWQYSGRETQKLESMENTMKHTIIKMTAVLTCMICGLLIAFGSQPDHREWILIESVATPQTVEVHTPHRSYNSFFSSTLRINRNGRASGNMELTTPDGDRLSYDANRGTGILRSTDGGLGWVVIQLKLIARTENGRQVFVTITPAATEDCLIYTTIGTDVHATWEAQGRIRVSDERN
jgi:hypothetical protein